MFKDRTTEFFQITERLRQTQPRKEVRKSLNGAAATSPKLQFTIAAGEIGKQIHETTTKLQNLTKLAKNTSLFNDKSEEIHQLTFVIKQDITMLNHQIETLQSHVQNQRLLHKNKQTENHATNIVSFLKANLAKTTKRFQSVLETRTKNLKVQQEKRLRLSGPAIKKKPDVFKPRPLTFGSSTSNGLSDAQGDDVVIQMGTMQQTQSLLGVHDSYLASRTEAVESIEQTIRELQGIFQQLATIVQDQGEILQRIDANVDDTLSNVTGAQDQLIKYMQRISGNRWLIVKVFFVLFIFILIFLVFFF